MEIEELENTKLVEISKKDQDSNSIIFERPRSRDKFKLEFKGWVFETPYSVLNKRVGYVNIRKALGFQAHSQLQYLHKDPAGYKQLLIQMQDSNDEHKVELICVFKNHKLNKLH